MQGCSGPSACCRQQAEALAQELRGGRFRSPQGHFRPVRPVIVSPEIEPSVGRRTFGVASVGGLAMIVLVALMAPSQAQNAGATLWARSGCADCHGNLAAGDGDPAYPHGPNLRRTLLTRDQLV